MSSHLRGSLNENREWTIVALAVFADQLTGGVSATALIGNALTLRILAFLLFSQPVGVIPDRFNRKKILIAADLLRFGLLALFPFVTTVWQIYVMIFAINAVTAFFCPTCGGQHFAIFK